MMYKNNKNEYLTVMEVASWLRLSPEMVYKLLHAGDLPSIRIGSSWRIPQQEFVGWLALRKMDSRRIHLTRPHRAVLNAFRRRLQETYGRRLKSLYVFGSVARGEEDAESDLDVAVVLKSLADRWKEKKKITQIAYQVTFGENRPLVLSSIVVSEKELMTRQEPLIDRIREEGRLAA